MRLRSPEMHLQEVVPWSVYLLSYRMGPGLHPHSELLWPLAFGRSLGTKGLAFRAL